MSEDITATLLPASRVDFYVLDDETSATASKLASDWRFARVATQVNRAGIEGAIAAYGQQASPDVIIIETNDISDAFLGQLEQLAGVCAEGTDAVIIGPMNDVHLYRSLVGMGVHDYLVRPVAEDDLVKVIAKAIVNKHGLSDSRIVAVLGAKGGVGSTTIAQALAWSIADGYAQKTMLMDSAGSAGSLGIAFGVEPAASLSEAVRVGASGTEDDLKRIIQSAGEHLSLMVYGGDPILTDGPDADSFETLVNRVMQKYPVVVIDLTGAAPSVQKRILARASHAVIVTTPMLSALRNCRTILNEMKSLRAGFNEFDVVVNMKGLAGSEEVDVKDIKSALDVEPALVVPYAPKIFAASEATGRPVGQNKAAADIMKAVSAVAERAAGLSAKDKEDAGKKEAAGGGFLKKLMGK